MKLCALSVLFLVLGLQARSQKSEDLIPVQAVSVFSVNNVTLLQKISLDDLVKYEFMEEVQQELFDGSTSGKTLKDSGIDFDQKLNVFTGKTPEYEISGLSFGVSDMNQLFEVFDDYVPIDSDYPEIQFYQSYFNRIAVKGSSGILFRITPNMRIVDEITDSIWYARGNDYPWYDEQYEELYNELEEIQEEEYEFMDEMETEENTLTPVEDNFPVADDDPTVKTYFELRDSVEMAIQGIYLKEFCDELFIRKSNLIGISPEFKQQLQRDSEGVFYSDNSRNFRDDSEFWYLRTIYPALYTDIQELYSGNIMLGDLTIGDEGIDLHLSSNYSEQLGSVYTKLTDTKFDKNLTKYIHKDNSAFFTYNVNLREAYEQMYNVITPILEGSDEPTVAANLLLIDLLNEYIDKDALFNTYKGSMFGTYSGIQTIKTKKVVFDYNEDTWEYIERVEEAEEDMPVFTLGISTGNNEFVEKILTRVARLNDRVTKQGDYWVVENGVLNAAPLYFVLKNDLFIITNNEDLAKNNSGGYGKNSISKSMVKKAKKSGAVYAYLDLGKAIESLPRGLFDDRENAVLDVVRGKRGEVELSSSETSATKTDFHLTYRFDGSIENSGTYILDLINSLYVVSK